MENTTERYYINYHTGAGDFWVEGDLDTAKAAADEGACYTQQKITIEDDDRNEISIRRWWGVEYDGGEDYDYEEDPICFGSFGYYSDWYDL